MQGDSPCSPPAPSTQACWQRWEVKEICPPLQGPDTYQTKRQYSKQSSCPLSSPGTDMVHILIVFMKSSPTHVLLTQTVQGSGIELTPVGGRLQDPEVEKLWRG